DLGESHPRWSCVVSAGLQGTDELSRTGCPCFGLRVSQSGACAPARRCSSPRPEFGAPRSAGAMGTAPFRTTPGGIKHPQPQWTVHRRAAVGLVCAIASVLALTVASAAQAAPQEEAARAAAALAPVQWSDYGQIIVNFNSGKCLQPQSNALQAFIEQRTCNNS